MPDSVVSRVPYRYGALFISIFFALFVLSPLYFQKNFGGDGLQIPFNILVWGAATFLIALGLLKILQTRQCRLPRLFYPVLLMLISITLVGLLNLAFDPISWLFRILALWGGGLFLLALHQFCLLTFRIEQCLRLVLVSILIQALIGFGQVLTEAGWFLWLPVFSNQPLGVFQQINVAASFQATGLAIGLYLLSRPSFKYCGWSWQLVLFAGAFCGAAVVAYSGSRVGVLGSVAALTLLFFCRFRQLVHRKKVTSIWLLLIMMGSFVGSQHPHEIRGFQSTGDKLLALTQGPPVAREVIYGTSFELIKDAPWFGHGIGSFERRFQDQIPNYVAVHPGAKLIGERVPHPHNELLYWLVEGGVLSVGSMIIVAIAYLWALSALGWCRGAAYGALALPIALHTQVEFPFYISSLHWLLFVFLVSLATFRRQKVVTITMSKAAQGLSIALLVMLPVLSVTFLTHALIGYKQLTEFSALERRDSRQLEMASANLYFSRRAEYVRMQALLPYAQVNRNAQLLTLYANWATDTLKMVPHITFYGGLALARHLLGDEAESQRVMAEALRIYPTSVELMRYKGMIESGRFPPLSAAERESATQPVSVSND